MESNDVVLLFNGDLYHVDHGEGDTEYLFELIVKARSEEEILRVFQTLVGPFSVICYFKSNLYFARDSLGRNSLIIGKHRENVFLSSALDPSGESFKAMELPPLGVYKLDAATNTIELFPYQNLEIHQHFLSQLEDLRKILSVTLHQELTLESSIVKIKPPTFSFDEVCLNMKQDNIFKYLLENSEINNTCETFIELLSHSVKDRVQRTPSMCKKCIETRSKPCEHCRVGILFSGGVDCSILAALSHKHIDQMVSSSNSLHTLFAVLVSGLFLFSAKRYQSI